MTTTGGWTTAQTAAAAQVTYRQLDYWVAQGWVPSSEAHPGSGSQRLFDLEARSIARWMGELVRAGFKPAHAATAARALHADGRATIGRLVIASHTSEEATP